MKKIMTLILITSLIVASLIGCASSEDQKQEKINATITLYYADSYNEKFVTEERQVSYTKDQDLYKIAIEELIKGPTNKEYRSNINKETKVLNTSKQNNDIVINLSSEFNNFSGSMAELFGVGAIVNTLTAFEGINRVKILTEGNELIGPSGEPRGFMEPLVNNEVTEPKPKEITLYFGNQDGTAVVAEKRTIEIAGNASQEELYINVLEELIKGPKTNLSRTIPNEVKVNSIELKDGILHVDFSEEMHIKHWGGATGEAMTIASIVSTLTEFDEVNKVKMTVSGQPMSIEHAILEEPLERNEDMIQK